VEQQTASINNLETHSTLNSVKRFLGVKVRSIPSGVALLMVVLTISSIGARFFKSGSTSETLIFESELPSNVPDLTSGSSPKMAEGVLRCEGAGAVVISIDGADYAVNGMVSRLYPPIQRVWNSSTHPENDIDRIIVRGLTLCDWGSKSHSTMQASAMN
jgi:hypothetical protein